jgi:hypothetical protein
LTEMKQKLGREPNRITDPSEALKALGIAGKGGRNER